jgi:Uma2 family endonuclease
MSMPAHATVSEAEYLALPESTQPMELIDGEVIVSPSPSFWHQEVLARIALMLRSWAMAQGASVTVAHAPLDVRFGPGRILQPDAMIFLAVLPRDTATPVERVPEICIEVLSTNRAHDRLTKRYVYAEAGVQEYWLVDPAGVVERRTGPGLARSEVQREQLTSSLLPGFALEVARIFEGL